MIQQRKKSNSSKVNLIISGVFHTVLILGITYLAAKEGYLGKTMKQLAVTMVKEKKAEPPKEKPPEPKVEQPKPEEAPKTAVAPPPVQQTAAPPPADAGPAMAPAQAVAPAFAFDGGKQVVEMGSTDPKSRYKALVEHTLRTRWNRPEDIADDAYVAEVELAVDRSGKITDTRWVRGSGDARWDNSVKAVLAETKAVGKGPPKGFPEKFVVRFDVESLRTEPIQLSSR